MRVVGSEIGLGRPAKRKTLDAPGEAFAMSGKQISRYVLLPQRTTQGRACQTRLACPRNDRQPVNFQHLKPELNYKSQRDEVRSTVPLIREVPSPPQKSPEGRHDPPTAHTVFHCNRPRRWWGMRGGRLFPWETRSFYDAVQPTMRPQAMTAIQITSEMPPAKRAATGVFISLSHRCTSRKVIR
jgi:hypothetical protein